MLVPLILAVSFIAFCLVRVAPGGPFDKERAPASPDIERNLKEMIDKWSEQDIPKELEHVRDGENLFIDKRGKISNHELTEPINLIG